MIEDRAVLGLVIIAGLLLFWFLLGLTSSRLSGWHQLTQVYRESASFHGEQWRFQRMVMRYGFGSKGLLTVGVNNFGIHLSIQFPFRLHYSPLFIPWSEVSAVHLSKRFSAPMVRLKFARFPEIPFDIFTTLAIQMRDAASGNFEIE